MDGQEDSFPSPSNVDSSALQMNEKSEMKIDGVTR